MGNLLNMVSLLSLLAAFGYALATLLQWQALKSRIERHPWIRALVGAALIAQATAIGLAAQEEGLSVGFFHVGATLTWLVMLLIWISDLKHPVTSLYIGLGPISALALTLSTIFSSEPILISDPRLWIHILMSLLAYGLLSVAAIQAFFVLIQDRSLRSGHPSAVIRSLPPLQTMDQLLIQFIILGMGLLTLSIISGFYFLDDLFAQHVAHKTLLSLVAWCLFATLLLGRHIKGWRGSLASKWTLSGFAVLMLAFFGSKFVLELLLVHP